MAKFVFELEDILQFRKFEQSDAENELAKALAVETEIQNNLNNLAFQKVQAQKEKLDTSDINAYFQRERFFDFLKKQTEELLEQMAQAKLVSEQKRQVLAEIMKKTDALESLKAQELREFREQQDFEEAEFMDDLAVTRAKKHQ